MFVFNWHFACLFVAFGFQICLLVAYFLDICSLTTYSRHTRNNCSSKSFVFLKEVSHPTSRRKNAGCRTGWVWHFTVAYIEGRTFVRTVGQRRHNQNFSHTWVYQNLLSMGLRAHASSVQSSTTSLVSRHSEVNVQTSCSKCTLQFSVLRSEVGICY